jgi:hypothetical protein
MADYLAGQGGLAGIVPADETYNGGHNGKKNKQDFDKKTDPDRDPFQ